MRWAPILLCALLLVPPVVTAAHVHDDRYMVVGRVIDDEGLPAGRMSLRVTITGTDVFVPAQAPQTTCMGDFQAIFDLDTVGDAEVEVTVQNKTLTQATDPVTRRTFVKIQAPDAPRVQACQDARANFDDRHVVTGRIMGSDGQPRAGLPVDVSLELPGGQPLERNGTTNAAGDFAILFQSSRLSEGGTVVVEASGDRWEQPMDESYRITVADHVVEIQPTSTRWALAALLVTVAIGAVAYVIYQRYAP